MSQPAWAAWIEISVFLIFSLPIWSQPAWAAWIEIATSGTNKGVLSCRSPHGLRGLKSFSFVDYNTDSESQPAWAAWIEISG